QQDAQYSMYMFNGLYINPAYAGSQEIPTMNALYRKQWTGFDGSPSSGSFAFHMPFKKDPNAIGFILGYDKIGVTEIYGLDAIYAYRIKLNDRYKISIGIQAGFDQYVADLTQVALPDPTQPDESFSDNRSLFLPNVGTGIYAYSDKFYAGFSIPHLLNNSLEESFELGPDSSARQFRHYFASVGYVFGKKMANVKFKPSILFKYVDNAPVDFDFNASILIIDRFWIGASYRTGGDYRNGWGESIIGMFEFMATPRLRVGYAYDRTISQLSKVNNGSHEIMIGWDFYHEDQRFVNPRYVKYF
ncbi:MAG: type IX secretion system membrane protein PorP/SprF, partial [Chitinophagales bacterium]|nr:type IX secretion system membrane protein PorP/SprF [Chitinophagales bacterium]